MQNTSQIDMSLEKIDNGAYYIRKNGSGKRVIRIASCPWLPVIILLLAIEYLFYVREYLFWGFRALIRSEQLSNAIQCVRIIMNCDQLEIDRGSEELAFDDA